MCGLAGIVRFDAPGSAHEARLVRLRDRLAHRGPDDAGMRLCSHAALGHRRLALIDREHGAQPMVSPDGRYSLVYNGEVYESATPPAWPLRTRSDAERVLAAFAAAGPEALAGLNGMFALFVWDEVEQVGYAARDRLGIKPLAYTWDGTELVFASEAGALARERPSRRADRDGVLEYLVAPCFSGVERTMFDGIHYLEPGELLRIDRSGLSRSRWAPRHRPIARGEQDETEAIARVRETLGPAVQRARRADVPVATFLSGGLDSTLIAALSPDAPAFSARYAAHDAFDHGASRLVVSDDVPLAEQAARELGLAHEWVDLPATPTATSLDAIARIDDALPAWEQELTQHHLFAAVHARGLKAVLVGDAADETHHGYHFLLDAEATTSPEALLRRFAGVPIRRDAMTDPIDHFAGHYRARLAEWGLGYGSPDDGRAATASLLRERFLPRLLHNGDIHSMAFSVEARVPFGDLALLAAADRVPMSLALAGGVEKRVLREAARGLLPEPFRTRRKSALPKAPTVDEAYRSLGRAVLAEPHPLVRAWVDAEGLSALLVRPQWSEAERGAVFRVVGLQSWADHFEIEAP